MLIINKIEKGIIFKKTGIKKVLLFVSFFLMSVFSFGQNKSLELGIQAGVSSCFCDVSPAKGISFRPSRAALGILLRKQIHPAFNLTGSFFYTTLAGDDYLFPKDDFRVNRGFYFTTKLSELTLYSEWDIFATKKKRKSTSFSTIFFSGPGIILISSSPSFERVKGEDFKEGIAIDRNAQYNKTQFIWLMGLGVKWQPQDYFSIRAKFGLRATFTDYLDGISAAGNSKRNDWFSIGNISMSFLLSQQDSDKDGVVDSKDLCPNIAGLVTLNGCPDSDGDGFPDHEDDCPLEPGLPYLYGCPDADNDGITDKKDKCPLEYGPVEHAGCPFKDSDGDGLDDLEDECPQLAGPPNRGGCPSIDSDGDGVMDEEDHCPTIFGILVFKGCPDSDGDGIEDAKDDCPHLFGVYEKKGCPLNLPTIEIVGEINRQYVNFKSGSYTPSSYAFLDKVAGFLKAESAYKLRLNGYSDSGGKHSQNLYVSRKRAKTCYTYLLNKGVSSRRMSYIGFGDKKAIADNATEAGRQQNRRVEFELYKN